MRTARRRRTARPLPVQLKARGHQARPTRRVSPARRQVPGPRAARLRRAGAAVRRSPQRRSHPQGQDVFAACGTPVVAARGGRVQARGSDPVLYGNWVVIDGRGTQHRLPVRPLRPPGLGPRRRAGEDRRADRPHRQDRQRPHGRLPAPLRGLALRAGTRRPATPADLSAGTAGASSAALLRSKLAASSESRAPASPEPGRTPATRRASATPSRSHSHSIVAGGFELMSRATRLTPGTSLMIRFDTRASRS